MNQGNAKAHTALGGWGPQVKKYWVLGLLCGFGILTFVTWFAQTEAFIADDSFFYLVVARHIVLDTHQTFSGLYSTNGFHPLWLYLLTIYSWFISLIDKDLLFHAEYILPLSILLVLGTIYNFYRIASKLKLDILSLTLLPLIYLAVFNLLYSEGHLFFYTLSALLWLTVNGTWQRRYGHYLIGVVSASIMLARLDSVFFVGAYYLWFFYKDPHKKRIILSALLSAGLVLPYLVTNIVFFGGMTPISGWIKSGFPQVIFTGIKYYGGYVVQLSGYNLLFGVVPLLLACYIFLFLPIKEEELSLLVPLFVGTFLHFLYIAFFVGDKTPWYWYFVQPVTLGAFSIALLMRDLHLPKVVKPVFFGLVLSMAVLILLYRSQQGFLPGIKEPLQYLQSNDIQNSTILVSDYPGTMAFYTNNQIIAADMLTGNRNFFEKMVKSGNALEYILTYSSNKGKPVSYVFFVGGKWLEPVDDRNAIIYYDPKQIKSKQVEIGFLEMGPPIAVIKNGGLGGNDFIVWHLSN